MTAPRSVTILDVLAAGRPDLADRLAGSHGRSKVQIPCPLDAHRKRTGKGKPAVVFLPDGGKPGRVHCSACRTSWGPQKLAEALGLDPAAVRATPDHLLGFVARKARPAAKLDLAALWPDLVDGASTAPGALLYLTRRFNDRDLATAALDRVGWDAADSHPLRVPLYRLDLRDFDDTPASYMRRWTATAPPPEGVKARRLSNEDAGLPDGAVVVLGMPPVEAMRRAEGTDLHLAEGDIDTLALVAARDLGRLAGGVLGVQGSTARGAVTAIAAHLTRRKDAGQLPARVVLWFDDDAAGHGYTAEAIATLADLVPVWCAKLPEGVKDVCDVLARDAWPGVAAALRDAWLLVDRPKYGTVDALRADLPALLAGLNDRPDLVTVLGPGCGVGKSHATRDFIVNALTAAPEGERPRFILACPTRELRDKAENALSAKLPKPLFRVESRKGKEDGCSLPFKRDRLEHGEQWSCKGCNRIATCPVGPVSLAEKVKHADVLVVTNAMLAELHRAHLLPTGATTLLDDPGTLTRITTADPSMLDTLADPPADVPAELRDHLADVAPIARAVAAALRATAPGRHETRRKLDLADVPTEARAAWAVTCRDVLDRWPADLRVPTAGHILNTNESVWPFPSALAVLAAALDGTTDALVVPSDKLDAPPARLESVTPNALLTAPGLVVLDASAPAVRHQYLRATGGRVRFLEPLTTLPTGTRLVWFKTKAFYKTATEKHPERLVPWLVRRLDAMRLSQQWTGTVKVGLVTHKHLCSPDGTRLRDDLAAELKQCAPWVDLHVLYHGNVRSRNELAGCAVLFVHGMTRNPSATRSEARALGIRDDKATGRAVAASDLLQAIGRGRAFDRGEAAPLIVVCCSSDKPPTLDGATWEHALDVNVDGDLSEVARAVSRPPPLPADDDHGMLAFGLLEAHDRVLTWLAGTCSDYLEPSGITTRIGSMLKEKKGTGERPENVFSPSTNSCNDSDDLQLIRDIRARVNAALTRAKAEGRRTKVLEIPRRVLGSTVDGTPYRVRVVDGSLAEGLVERLVARWRLDYRPAPPETPPAQARGHLPDAVVRAVLVPPPPRLVAPADAPDPRPPEGTAPAAMPPLVLLGVRGWGWADRSRRVRPAPPPRSVPKVARAGPGGAWHWGAVDVA